MYSNESVWLNTKHSNGMYMYVWHVYRVCHWSTPLVHALEGCIEKQ